MNKKNISFTYLIIIFSFILSIAISNYNIKNYDKNVENLGSNYHKMIKSDPYRYLSHGAEIKKDLEEGKSFFSTGRENYTKYLPPRLAALYYHYFNYDLFNNFDDKIINTGIHNYYLYIQCFIFYLSVFFLFRILKENFNKKISFIVIFFLCLEPTIIQYHGSFWSESIFFSIQILIFGLLIKKEKNLLIYLLTGFLIGILSLQKQMAIFYIIPILFLLLVTLKKKKGFSIFSIISGYIIVQLFIGYNNFSRSGEFYVLTADTKLDLHRDLVVKVISKKMNISNEEFENLEGEAAKEWLNEKNINFNENHIALKNNKSFMDYRLALLNENDKIKFDNFILDRTFDYVLNNKIDFTKFVVKKSLHTVLLNPFHIYSHHNFVNSDLYYFTKTHDNLVLVRIIYTLIIYIFCMIGLIQIYKKKEFELLILLFLSIAYFYGLVSWHGNTRYFVPNLIYLSFFFGFGLEKVLSKLK